jgi:TonB family protein
MAATAMANPQTRMSAAFTKSLVFHAVLLGSMGGWAWNQVKLGIDAPGSPIPGTVEIVDSIPLKAEPVVTPVANESKSILPQEEPDKPAPKEKEREPEKADLLPGKTEKPKVLTPKSRLPSLTQIDQQPTRSTEKQAGGPQTATKGSPQINKDNLGDVFGNRLGWYATRIREITSQNWDTTGVKAGTTPPVTLRFVLLRSGKVKDVKVRLSSGIEALDLSARNAVEDSTYPPLPPEFEKNEVEVEFTFRLRP